MLWPGTGSPVFGVTWVVDAADGTAIVLRAGSLSLLAADSAK